jgi:hypothetical protein
VIADVGPGGTVMSGGYLNFAAEAGVSRVRDKSTCVYHLCVAPNLHLLSITILDYHGVMRGRKAYERNVYYDD